MMKDQAVTITYIQKHNYVFEGMLKIIGYTGTTLQVPHLLPPKHPFIGIVAHR